MKKALTLAVILLGVFLFTSVARAEFTDREKQICYDLYETMIFSSMSENAAYAEVASKYGITVNALKNIEAKSKDEDPTDWDMEVYHYLTSRLKSLPQGYSQEQAKSIYNEVASKYGIRRGQVHAIEIRCFQWAPPE